MTYRLLCLVAIVQACFLLGCVTGMGAYWVFGWPFWAALLIGPGLAFVLSIPATMWVTRGDRQR